MNVSSAFHEQRWSNAVLMLGQAETDVAGFLGSVIGKQMGNTFPENSQFPDDLIMNDGSDGFFAAPGWHAGVDFRVSLSFPFKCVALFCCFGAQTVGEKD